MALRFFVGRDTGIPEKNLGSRLFFPASRRSSYIGDAHPNVGSAPSPRIVTNASV